MYLLQSSNVRQFLLGEEDWSFLIEVLFRSAIMFIVALVAVRIIGKRGIMEGVFGLVVITELLKPNSSHSCPVCKRKEWVVSSDARRVK